MTIKGFVQDQVLLPRLRQLSALTVYDPDGRYRELCLELASPNRRVLDAGESSIESRAAAMAALQELGKPNTPLEGLLVYVPARPPLTDEDRQRDPFAVYAACGAVFPDGDGDGDEYLSLCLRARADHATEIRRIFNDNPNPSFAVIDAVGSGAGWPHLQAMLQVESARDILFALLAPAEQQQASLKGQDAWVTEAKALVQNSLGMKLMTRAKSWGAVADELWRFLLFSEFVFDLPGDLPSALVDAPHAEPEARPVIEDLCDRLRNDQRTQAGYIERAEAIELELRLPTTCQMIEYFGVRDTFPFEERSFFREAVDALKRDNIDHLRHAFARHTHSVWVGRGENQVQWLLLQAAASLVEACGDAERQLSAHTRSLDALIDFYVSSLREVDRLQREFEHAASDFFDVDGHMADVNARARTAYRRLADTVQGNFLRQVEKSGWPPPGRLANVDVFDKLVAPKLQESGRRVALLLIDALRYELGVELQKQAAEDGQVELQAAFAWLPSVTPVGMASLLPGAGQDLRLVRKDDKLVPMLGEQALTTVAQRMEVLRRRYGVRFFEVGLTDFVHQKMALPAAVELLVIRSNEMDNDFESNPEAAPGRIRRTLQQIGGALHKLRDLRFQDALVVTDHGFYLNTDAGAGDVCTKPSGTWLAVHERMLLGNGVGDAANFALPAATLGMRGDWSQVAGPRAMVAYRAGQTYFHGGLSLQEALVPVISVRLAAVEASDGRRPTVTLSYKRDAKRVTTRLPMVEVTVGSGDLFSMGSSIEILLEAQDRKGTVVGEAKAGGPINPATQTLTVMPRETVQVTLKMDLAFEGKFTVKALDPTTLATFSKLDLETDYTV